MDAHKAEWVARNPSITPPWESRYGAAMDDGEQWPPLWKPVEQCPEYEVIGPYLERRVDDDVGRLFIEKLRETRVGYDIRGTEAIENSFFWQISPILLKKDDYRQSLTEDSNLIIDKINERAKLNGELYVFDDIEKLVTWRMWAFFLTFSVREVSSNNLKTVEAYIRREPGCDFAYVKEWRFKP